MLDEVSLTRGNSEKVQDTSSLDFEEKTKLAVASDEPDTPPNESKSQAMISASSGIQGESKAAPTSNKQTGGGNSVRLNKKPQRLDSDTKSQNV